MHAEDAGCVLVTFKVERVSNEERACRASACLERPNPEREMKDKERERGRGRKKLGEQQEGGRKKES